MAVSTTHPPVAPAASVELPKLDPPDFATMLTQLQLGWQSAARRRWRTIAQARFAIPQPFKAAGWVATHLDLRHPPLPERDTPLLAALSIIELKLVYHTLSTAADLPDWEEFVWDMLADMLERAV